jgi:hypothetical protein
MIPCCHTNRLTGIKHATLPNANKFTNRSSIGHVHNRPCSLRPKLSSIITELKDAASTPADRLLTVNEKTGVGKCKGSSHPAQAGNIRPPATCLQGSPCYCTAGCKLGDQYFCLNQASEDCASTSLFCGRYRGLLKPVWIKAIHPILPQHNIRVKNNKRTCALKG